MPEFQSIEIDFDIHQLIEKERRSFSEPRFQALRRLLKLDSSSELPRTEPPTRQNRSWSVRGVTLQHGTKLQMEYNGRKYEGQIVDGKWLVEGKTFSSPSGAASGVAITKYGDLTKLDGWNYWRAQQPEETSWASLRALRKAHRDRLLKPGA